MGAHSCYVALDGVADPDESHAKYQQVVELVFYEKPWGFEARRYFGYVPILMGFPAPMAEDTIRVDFPAGCYLWGNCSVITSIRTG